MLSVFKNFIFERLAILAINVRNTYEEETAYFANNWAHILSTTVFTLTYLVFINVLYANVDSIAGNSKDEMLFFTLINQLNFYSLFSWSYHNLDELIKDVNRGDLDMILTKPLPHLFYITFRKVSVIQLLRDATIPLIAVISVINWSELSLNRTSLLAGIVVLICGQIAFHTVQFFLAIPVFWKGESRTLFNLAYTLFNPNIPFEGYPTILKVGLTVFLPILISTALSTSVILNKTNPLLMVIFSVSIAATCLALKSWGWKLALRNYTSASS